MLGCADQRNAPLDARRAEASAASRHRPGDGEEPLAVGQFQPLGDDLSRSAESRVHRPQGAAPAVARKGKARPVQPLGDVARRIDPDEEEGHPLRSGLLQCRQPVSGLFETGAELATQGLDVIALHLGGAGEGAVRHDDSRRRIGRESSPGQPLAAVGGKDARRRDRVDLVRHFKMRDLLGHLEMTARGVQRVVEQKLPSVQVQPAHRPDHDVGGQTPHRQPVPRQEPPLKAALDRHRLGQPLRRVVQGGKRVASRRQKPPRLPHRIRRALVAVQSLHAPVGQGQMLLLIGGVEPQQSLGDAREIGRQVGVLQRRQVDVGEHRILQHPVQSGRDLRSVRPRQGRHVDLVGLGQPQQHIGRQRPVVALKQGDVGGRHLKVRRHVGLGQT